MAVFLWLMFKGLLPYSPIRIPARRASQCIIKWTRLFKVRIPSIMCSSITYFINLFISVRHALETLS